MASLWSKVFRVNLGAGVGVSSHSGAGVRDWSHSVAERRYLESTPEQIVWGHSGAGVGVWSHPGAGVGVWTSLLEYVIGVTPVAGVGIWSHSGTNAWCLPVRWSRCVVSLRSKCLESLRSWSRCVESSYGAGG